MLTAKGLLHVVYFCLRICLSFIFIRMFFSSMLPLLGEIKMYTNMNTE